MSPTASASVAASTPSLAALRVVTELDQVRLEQLARRGAPAQALEEVIDGADIVPVREVPADVVTMNTRLVAASDAGERELVLVYPADADAATGHVSVLSPMGTALLGRRVADTAHWTTSLGRQESLRIAAIAYQPEAAGDYLV